MINESFIVLSSFLITERQTTEIQISVPIFAKELLKHFRYLLKNVEEFVKTRIDVKLSDSYKISAKLALRKNSLYFFLQNHVSWGSQLNRLGCVFI